MRVTLSRWTIIGALGLGVIIGSASGCRSGASGWSTGAFQTVAPAIQVTAPNGGEAWRRGVKNFIRWNDNLAENVVFDLYKAGDFLKSLNTNSSAGAYQWEVGLDLVPGSDYSIKIRSATNATVFDTSDATFSIIDALLILME